MQSWQRRKLKGSANKRSKLPIEVVNAKKQSKIDKLNNAQGVSVIADSNGVRITFNSGQWVGISPEKARQISADLLIAATEAEKQKKVK